MCVTFSSIEEGGKERLHRYLQFLKKKNHINHITIFCVEHAVWFVFFYTRSHSMSVFLMLLCPFFKFYVLNSLPLINNFFQEILLDGICAYREWMKNYTWIVTASCGCKTKYTFWDKRKLIFICFLDLFVFFVNVCWR